MASRLKKEKNHLGLNGNFVETWKAKKTVHRSTKKNSFKTRPAYLCTELVTAGENERRKGLQRLVGATTRLKRGVQRRGSFLSTEKDWQGLRLPDSLRGTVDTGKGRGKKSAVGNMEGVLWQLSEKERKFKNT